MTPFKTNRRIPTLWDRQHLQEEVHRLIHRVGSTPYEELIQEMILTILKLVQDQADRGDLKVINTALKEMRYAARVFAPYRRIRKVTIFGSSRTQEWEPVYLQATSFARKITDYGFMVITGAGEGIMKAGQAGAGRERSFGMNIRLPFEQTPNIYIQGDPKLITFKYFFTRKLTFMKETHALALFPGGFGTHDEAFEALTLLQTGKSNPMPLVFLDAPGGDFWQAWYEYMKKHLLGQGMISEEDFHHFRLTDNVDEAVEEIVGFYRHYHSMRYVGDRLVIRLNTPPTPTLLERLNTEFADLLSRGTIQPSPPLPEEANEPETHPLPRLVLSFNRRNYGRLRQMLDTINRCLEAEARS